MNIAQWSIEKSTVTWVVTAILFFVGLNAFTQLSRLEDPEFTIKEAVIVTPYLGASAAEVESEVTDLIERAVQEMGQLMYVESHSYRDKSFVKVRIQDQYDKTSLPQVWDELRRNIGDVQAQLPPGAGPSIVNDDFGDVFGVYLAITGDGYTARELYEVAKLMRRELLLVEDVKKIILYGVQKEVIYVEMQREKMSALNIAPKDIYNALGSKNIAVLSGYISTGEERIAVNPTGEFVSEKQFKNLLVSARGENNKQISLGDVAKIVRGYQDPPLSLLRYNGKPAVGIAISTAMGGNVITMGEGLSKKLSDLTQLIPVGVDLNIVSMQSDSVIVAIDAFLISLLEAIAIVIVVLLFFMGLRSGLIIGSVLVITIMGTFIFMQLFDVTLERISLGALIIALGMLVDNAIVVTDGMRVRIDNGEDSLTAAKAVVGQTATPLLAATAVAIAAFAAIGTSEDSTGEYTRTLFSVILISLTMSWFTAVTITPMLCHIFLKPKAGKQNETAYNGAFYQLYRSFLRQAIQYRWVSIAVVLAIFASSIYFFGFVKNSFFPDSTRPQIYLDVWYPEGTDIRETERRLTEVEKKLLEYDHVTNLATQIGGGSPRFLLTYTPEQAYPNFGRILIDVDDFKSIPALFTDIQQSLEQFQPSGLFNTRLFVLGPATGGKIQLRISGPDRNELRKLTAKVKRILVANDNVKGLRDEWDLPTKVIRPRLSDTQAKKLGVDRPEVAKALSYANEGAVVGLYRERDELLPIIARAPEQERHSLGNLSQTLIWSPVANSMVPIGQVVTHFDLSFEDAHIWRRDRVTMQRLHFDQRRGLSSELLNEVKADIEKALNADLVAYFDDPAMADAEHTSKTIPIKYLDQIPIKNMPGYYFAWGGENEDSVKGSTSIAKSIPVFFGIMVFLVILLFNSLRMAAVIWLVVPLSIVGVTIGLLLFKQPFGFMALLGFMSLAGMLIKNAIVLVDQINFELAAGKQPIDAVVESGVSRLIPVSMAALTTILGMIPLLGDAFFVAMAVTIMLGLGFATVLTLVVVPVLYATIFRFKS